ncbi:MAG TPA: hypothetical protein VEC12_14500 [Bacteroidia bacterium]|nr:hypothetical protein [Bacteroidia bacterium]
MFKRKIIIVLAIILLIIILIGAWFYFNPKKALQFVAPDLEKIELIHGVLKNDTVYLDVFAVLQNKAPYKITIDSLIFDIILDTTVLVKERRAINIKMGSGQVDTTKLSLKLPVKKARKVIERLQGRDSTTLTGNFRVKYNTFLGRVDVPFSRVRGIKVPNPPEITVTDILREKVEFFKGKASIITGVQVVNENKHVTVKLDSLKYEIALGEGIKAYGSYNHTVTVAGGAVTQIKLPAKIEVDKPMATLLKVLFDKDEVNFTLTLSALLTAGKAEELPVEFTIVGITEIMK